MITDLQVKFEDKERTGFHASDYGKLGLDLYFSWTGEPKTNPPRWNDTLKWGAGKGVEEAMLKVLKDSGHVNEDYDQKEHGRISIERNGIEVHGYIDAITKEGKPIEIKSINNANVYDIKKYQNKTPRENYVGQLAIYLDSLGLDHGYLFVASIDGLNTFWFDCNRMNNRIFQCGTVMVDLDKEYQRWADLYNNHIVPRQIPNVWEKRYKKPVTEIDWTKLSKSDITKARNNRKVIGDFEVSYSDWKSKIIELQGGQLGYTDKELEYIKEQTAGFSNW